MAFLNSSRVNAGLIPDQALFQEKQAITKEEAFMVASRMGIPGSKAFTQKSTPGYSPPPFIFHVTV